MRYFSKISLFFLFALFLFSCQKENMDPIGEWELVNPSIIAPQKGASLTLDEATPASQIVFTWDAASASSNYEIRYSIALDTLGSAKFDSPIIEFSSDNGGKATSASITYDELDEALSMAGYPANAESPLTWAVLANCVGRIGVHAEDIIVTRFVTERIPNDLYLSGTASENGGDLASALKMKKLSESANVFEIYTHLEAGGGFKFYSRQKLPAFVFGGEGTSIIKNGKDLSVTEPGEYQVRADLDKNELTIKKITRIGVIGAPFKEQWNNDEALVYRGAGVWAADINFLNTGSYVIRINQDDQKYLKQIVGKEGKLIPEEYATANNIAVEDISATKTGTYKVSVDLSGGGYTIAIESSNPGGGEPVATPEALFLLDEGNAKICEFVKDGDVYNSEIYVALQNSVTYKLNAKADGSGTTYIFDANLGAAEDAAADKVSGKPIFKEGTGTLSIDTDQAYQISLDFAQGQASWHYYNLKAFNWDNAADGGWDARKEFAMTYEHPYQYKVTADFEANFDIKFNSPWEVEFGAKEGTSDDVDALSGTTTNKTLQGDEIANNNFKFVKSSGSYTITLTINNDFKKGDYVAVAN